MKVEVVELLSDSDDDQEPSTSTPPPPPPVAEGDSSDDLEKLLEVRVTSISLIFDQRGCVKHERVIYPKRGGRGSVQVSGSDLARLKPDECLNDTCIDLYIKSLTPSPLTQKCDSGVT